MGLKSIAQALQNLDKIKKKNYFYFLYCSQGSFVFEKKFKKYFCYTQSWFIRLWKVKNFSKIFFFNFQNRLIRSGLLITRYWDQYWSNLILRSSPIFPWISSRLPWTLLILKLELVVYTLAWKDIYEDRAYWF